MLNTFFMELPSEQELQKELDQLHLVRAQIKDLLHQANLCGVVLIADRHTLDYALELETPWTCTRFEKDPATGDYLLRIKTTDLPETEKKEKLTETAGAFLGLIDGLHHIEEQLRSVTGLLSKHFDFEHSTQFLPREPETRKARLE